MTKSYDPWMSVIYQIASRYFEEKRWDWREEIDEDLLARIAFGPEPDHYFSVSKHRWPEILEAARAQQREALVNLAKIRLLA